MRSYYVYLSPCLPQNSTQPVVAAAVNTPATASINNINTTFSFYWSLTVSEMQQLKAQKLTQNMILSICILS